MYIRYYVPPHTYGGERENLLSSCSWQLYAYKHKQKQNFWKETSYIILIFKKEQQTDLKGQIQVPRDQWVQSKGKRRPQRQYPEGKAQHVQFFDLPHFTSFPLASTRRQKGALQSCLKLYLLAFMLLLLMGRESETTVGYQPCHKVCFVLKRFQCVHQSKPFKWWLPAITYPCQLWLNDSAVAQLHWRRITPCVFLSHCQENYPAGWYAHCMQSVNKAQGSESRRRNRSLCSITVDCRGRLSLKQKVNCNFKRERKKERLLSSFFHRWLSVYTEPRSFTNTSPLFWGLYWTDITQTDWKHLFIRFGSFCTKPFWFMKPFQALCL